MKIYPWVGGDLELSNLLSGDSAKARVVGTRRSKDGAFLGVAVALVVPNETFSGVNFQLRKTTADLANIEQAIGSGGVDPRILREFREAADYVRKAAWVVHELQERQLQKHDPQTVLPTSGSPRYVNSSKTSKAQNGSMRCASMPSLGVATGPDRCHRYGSLNDPALLKIL